jgi:chromosomal replication initiator protein
MVDGVVDIPLPARPTDTAADQSGAAAIGHFLVGPENRLVEVAVRSIVERQPNGYNPLVFYGPSGTGKSHLARGLANAWKARNRSGRVVYTTAADFHRELIEAIQTQAVDEFRAKHRGANLWVVEDLGLLATRKSDKLSAQEELIHTFDALLADGRWVIVTASAVPSDLPGIVPALKSRLTGGLTVPLAPPGPEARLALLHQLAALRNIRLPESVARALAEGLSGTVPELSGMLGQLEGPLRQQHGRLDVSTARQYLALRDRAQQPSLHEIALATSRHFSLRLVDLRGSSRRRALVTARGVAVYLARQLTEESLQKIGAYFSGRDHTTVMHGCHKMEKLLRHDPAIQEAIKSLQKTLCKT